MQSIKEPVWRLKRLVHQSKRKLGLARRFDASLCQYKLSGHIVQTLDKRLQTARASPHCQGLWQTWASLNGNHRLKGHVCVFLSPFIHFMWSWCMKSYKKCVSNTPYRPIQSSHMKNIFIIGNGFFPMFYNISLIMLQCEHFVLDIFTLSVNNIRHMSC